MSTQQPLSALKIFLIYLRLGCLSFGGPVAHLGYFKEEFVSCRKWLNEPHFAELLALCQFVPGPSSSQLGFAIAWQRGGLRGACAAWLGFSLPSALIMITCAYGLAVSGDATVPLIHGLLIAAVAVVAKAVLDLGKKLCPDWPRIAIAVGGAALALSITGAWIQIGVILLGVAIGNALFRNTSQDKPPAISLAVDHTLSDKCANVHSTSQYSSITNRKPIPFAAPATDGTETEE